MFAQDGTGGDFLEDYCQSDMSSLEDSILCWIDHWIVASTMSSQVLRSLTRSAYV